MGKVIYKFTYDDLKNPNNNCIVSTLKQLVEKCNIPYRTLQDIFGKSNVHYERTGLFKVEKRVHYVAKSKIRNK